MKILVIRLKQIGDALISLPVCKSLKKTFPDAQVDYLLYEHIAPLFEHHSAIDHVLVITPEERRRQWQYFKKMLAIRRARYDMVIDLMTVPVTVLMTRLSGARWQVGFDKGKWRSRLYNTPVLHPKNSGSLEAKLAILNGLPFKVDIDHSFDVVVTPEEMSAMRQRMTDAGMDLAKPTLLFSPISRLSSKNWPQDHFASVVDYCLDQFDAQAVLIWGPGERDAVAQLVGRIKPRDRVFASIETVSLRELAALSQQCAMFIGNDSGPRHVAEAVGIPTFTIFSPPIGKFAWLPHAGDRHRGVDMCDALNIDEKTWYERVHDFHSHRDRYFRKITPELVISRLRPMLNEFVAS